MGIISFPYIIKISISETNIQSLCMFLAQSHLVCWCQLHESIEVVFYLPAKFNDATSRHKVYSKYSSKTDNFRKTCVIRNLEPCLLTLVHDTMARVR